MNNENCNDTFERNSKVNIAKEIAERGWMQALCQ